MTGTAASLFASETARHPRTKTVIRPPGASGLNVFRDLAALPRHVDLLHTLSLHRVKVRYTPSVLGVLWAIVQPLSMMAIFTILFSIIGKTPGEALPPALFFYAALVPWTFFATAVGTSTSGLVSHAYLITKVYFPREIVPLTYMLAALFDFLMAFVVLLGMMMYFSVPLTMNALYAIPILLVLMLFTMAAALGFSILQVQFRDIGVAMPLLLQLWMFLTPVMYPLTAVPEQLTGFYMFNPTVGLIENFRRVVVQGVAPDFPSLGVATLVSVLLLPPAYIYFKRKEATMADVI